MHACSAGLVVVIVASLVAAYDDPCVNWVTSRMLPRCCRALLCQLGCSCGRLLCKTDCPASRHCRASPYMYVAVGSCSAGLVVMQAASLVAACDESRVLSQVIGCKDVASDAAKVCCASSDAALGGCSAGLTDEQLRYSHVFTPLNFTVITNTIGSK